MTLAWSAFRGALALHLRLYLFRQSRIITGVAMPVTTAAIAVLVLSQGPATPEQYFHVMVGGGLAGMWGAVLGTAMMTLRREREWYGTLPLLTAVAAPLEAIFGGYLVAESLAGFLGVVMSLGAGVALLGAPLGLASPGTLLVSLPVAAVAVAAIAFPIMPLVLVAPVLTRWINGMEYPVWILAGFLFPIALLPAWTTPLSYGLPAYWATEALRQASRTDGAWQAAAPLWLITLALCAGYLAFGLWLLRLVVRRVQRSGAVIAQ